MPKRTHLVLRMLRHLGDPTEHAAAPWEGGRAVPKQGAQGMVYMRSPACHGGADDRTHIQRGGETGTAVTANPGTP